MFERVKTKTGEVVWLRTGKGDYLGRHEIARIEFAKWEAKQLSQTLKTRS